MRAVFISAALFIAACGSAPSDSPCSGQCADTPQRLEIADVQRVLAQGVLEAQARGDNATFAVVDRSGNLLGLFRMNGADTSITVDGGRGIAGGLEQINVVPDTLAALAKAITGAYLSSEGNAFSTRTASMIVQQFFYPGEVDQPGGPLFGVQFSSLPCSDLVRRFNGTAPSAGPQRSPLGLSADAGGFPLYKNGTVIGGIGVMSDGIYGLDLDVLNEDADTDELIALAALRGYEAPADREASRITVDGKTLRYRDARPDQLLSAPSSASAFAALDGVAGQRLSLSGYSTSNALVAGTAFGQPESGLRPATGGLAARDAFVLVDDADAERFPAQAAGDGAITGVAALTAPEASTLLDRALNVAQRTRAQIRRPLGDAARVSVAVVDTEGRVLGLARSRDAPVFGADVALQKARSAMFLSNAAAASDLLATPDTTYLADSSAASIADYVQGFRDFLGQPAALSDGAVAYSARSLGNLARPYFPDGIRAPNNFGPLSKRIGAWSPFTTGLQLDLVNSAIGQHVGFVLGGGADGTPGSCTGMPATSSGFSRLPNGLQIFAGGVPIYRGSTLVGGLGVSGDGVDQDDLIAFLGLHEASLALGTLNHAPAAMRADQLAPQGARLRYVQCPQTPYRDSNAQNVCAGL